VQDFDELFGVAAAYEQLELIGGELLNGSGLEAEQTDPDFAATEISEISAEEA
jgi:hypothetical protein